MSSEDRRRIGILGGTFDPVHIGHLQMAANAMATCSLDEVRFVPAYAPPHKKDKEDNAEDRLAMLTAALEDNPAFTVDSREMRARKKRYSLETVRSFREDFPQAELFFVLGEDSLMEIRTWHRWQELLAMIPIIVCPRGGVTGELLLQVKALNEEGYCVQIANGPSIAISSTQIREAFSKGGDLRYFLPNEVYNYIASHRLYGFTSGEDAAFLRGVQKESLDFLETEIFLPMVERLRSTLSAHRFRHVQSVARSAVFLAKLYDADVERVRLAALLHDCAKGREQEYFRQLHEKGILKAEDWMPAPSFHAYLGGFVAREVYGVQDNEVLEAIAAHTTGSSTMSQTAKIVFLADEIEPYRDFPFVVHLRALSMKNLDRAVLAGMDASLRFLMKKEQVIDPASLFARNALIKKKQEQETAKNEQ